MKKGKSIVKNKLNLLAQYVFDLVRLDCVPYCTSGSIIETILTCSGLKHSSGFNYTKYLFKLVPDPQMLGVQHPQQVLFSFRMDVLVCLNESSSYMLFHSHTVSDSVEPLEVIKSNLPLKVTLMPLPTRSVMDWSSKLLKTSKDGVHIISMVHYSPGENVFLVSRLNLPNTGLFCGLRLLSRVWLCHLAPILAVTVGSSEAAPWLPPRQPV